MTAAAPPVEGAVVFTDIVDFTEYTALRGDEEAVALLTLQETLVQQALPASARIVKELGDGLLLWFSDAVDALRTTLGLQDSFDEAARKRELPLWVRIGVHWGRSLERRGDLPGHDVNLCSRITSMAGPGDVVASAAAQQAAGDRMPEAVFEELGPIVLRGIPEPVALYRVTRG